MEETKKCPKCQSTMDFGYVPDFVHGNSCGCLAAWHQGEPEAKTFLGLKTGGLNVKEDGLPLVAYRCPKCSLVEWYAMDVSES